MASWNKQPKTFISYWIAFTIGYFLYTKLIPFINVQNIYAQLLIGGLIIELSAKTLQMFLYDKYRIRLDKWFLLWVLIHTINIWIVLEILEFLNLSITSENIELIVIGLSLTIITHIVWWIMYRGGRKSRGRRGFNFPDIPEWLWIIIIILIIIFFIQFRVPYGEPHLLNDFNLNCKDGKIYLKNNLMGLGDLAFQMEASVSCMEYKSSVCQPICFNDKPACQCKTALVHRLFSRQGEWIFDGW